MTRNSQEQTGGADSTNVQAGRDVVLHGPSFEEMEAIALAVYERNAIELGGIAADLAVGRSERLTKEFIRKVAAEDPLRLQKLQDPDVQAVLFEAQSAYARSGEEDLAKVLADLMFERMGEPARNLRVIALNETVEVVAKLTEGQRKLIAVAFQMRHTSRPNPIEKGGVEDVVHSLRANLVPMIPNSLGSVSDFAHMEYAGVARTVISQRKFGESLKSGEEGRYTRGFPATGENESVTELPGFETYFAPNSRVTENFSMRSLSFVEHDKALEAVEDTELRTRLTNLARQGIMNDDEVRNEAISLVPELAEFAAKWDESRLSQMELTTTGLVIGHTYWQRTSGNTTSPLSIWIDD